MWGLAAKTAAIAWMAGAVGVAQTSTPNITTGLWEVQVTSHMSGAGLPPSMATQQLKYRMCVTPQNIQESFAAAMQRKQNSCTQSNQKMSASGLSVDFSCDGGATTGHVDVVFDSSSAAHGTMHATSQIGGNSVQTESSSSGKWLSVSCGSVRPGDAQIVR